MYDDKDYLKYIGVDENKVQRQSTAMALLMLICLIFTAPVIRLVEKAGSVSGMLSLIAAQETGVKILYGFSALAGVVVIVNLVWFCVALIKIHTGGLSLEKNKELKDSMDSWINYEVSLLDYHEKQKVKAFMWNPIYNKVMEVKREYERKFGGVTYEMAGQKTCFEVWLDLLNNPELTRIFSCMEMVMNSRANKAVCVIEFRQKGTYEISQLQVLSKEEQEFYLESHGLAIDVLNEVIFAAPLKGIKTAAGEKVVISESAESWEFASLSEVLKERSLWLARYIHESQGDILIGNPFVGYNGLVIHKNVLVTAAHETMMKRNPSKTFFYLFSKPDGLPDNPANFTEKMHRQVTLMLIGARDIFTGEHEPFEKVEEMANDVNVAMKREQLSVTEIVNKQR